MLTTDRSQKIHTVLGISDQRAEELKHRFAQICGARETEFEEKIKCGQDATLDFKDVFNDHLNAAENEKEVIYAAFCAGGIKAILACRLEQIYLKADLAEIINEFGK